MAYLQMKLDKLESNLQILKNAGSALSTIITAEERGQTVYVSLKKVETKVNDLHDELLTNHYNKIFSVFLSGVPQQQILPQDYFSFLQRLCSLLEEAIAQASEACISLQEGIGPKSVITTGSDHGTDSSDAKPAW